MRLGGLLRKRARGEGLPCALEAVVDGAGVGDLERVRFVCCEGLQTVSALNLQICSTVEPLLSGCGELRFFDANFKPRIRTWRCT